MLFQNAQNTDARHAIFNDVAGDQYNEFNLPGTSSKGDILKQLQPASMDGSRRTGCLENTRSDILMLVIDWASDPASPQSALWLYGPAGSGKSTISTTLADRFRRSKQLGAFLFFDRDITERSNPSLVARTLAYQLGSFHPEIRDLISAVIESSPQTLISPIHSQFQELLVDPLSSIESLRTKSQIVIILDALDECGTTKDRKALAELLTEMSAHLPSIFRLVITSRLDLDIRLAFESQPHVLTLELDLTSTTIYNDIRTYFRHHINIIKKKRRILDECWPSKKNIHVLVCRASGLFVWAAIACNFIDAHDPQKRLDIILQGNTMSTAEAALDGLYRRALQYAGEWDDEDFVADFRVIIGMMLVLRNPLTSAAIDNLLGNPDGRPSSRTVEQLSCVLSLNPTVRFIHPSLADFFLNRSRCDRDIWFFTPKYHERNLGILCLHRLDQVLHSDMSQSALFVENTVPQDVKYACLFWVDHICTIDDDLWPIEKLLKRFLNRHIRHWFEAMSLLKGFGLVIPLLDQLSEWIQSHPLRSQTRLLELVRYWWRFSREYETRIQDSPMQVYNKELLLEFQLINVQEPLELRPLPASILDLALQSLPSMDDMSPLRPSLPPISSLESPFHPDSLDSTPQVSRPASPFLSSVGQRLSLSSRSSLNIPSPWGSSSAPMSRSSSPLFHDSPDSNSPVLPFSSATHLRRSSLSYSSRRNSPGGSPASQPASLGPIYSHTLDEEYGTDTAVSLSLPSLTSPIGRASRGSFTFRSPMSQNYDGRDETLERKLSLRASSSASALQGLFPESDKGEGTEETSDVQKGSAHRDSGAVHGQQNDVPQEYRLEMDRIFFEFLNNICSNLEASDSKGEPIHHMLMVKKMRILEEFPDFRSFRFRIHPFTNAFLEEFPARQTGISRT